MAPPMRRGASRYARRLAAEGVRDVTSTPHINHYWPVEIESIPERVDALRAALLDHDIRVRVHPGGELDARYARRLQRRGARADRTGAGGQPLAARRGAVPRARRRVRRGLRGARDARLRRRDRTPRARRRRGEPEAIAALRSLLDAGAVAQVNVCSLLGNNGLSGAGDRGPAAAQRTRLRDRFRRASGDARAHARARLRARPAGRRVVGPGVAADPGEPPVPAGARDPAGALRAPPPPRWPSPLD